MRIIPNLVKEFTLKRKNITVHIKQKLQKQKCSTKTTPHEPAIYKSSKNETENYSKKEKVLYCEPSNTLSLKGL